MDNGEELILSTIDLLRSMTNKEILKLSIALSKNYTKAAVNEFKEYYAKELEFDPSKDVVYRTKEDGTIECIGLKEHKYDLLRED